MPDFSERELRDALGRFATGVTVVTTMTARGPLGITANSFASVSLAPPLVLWSPARKSRRFPAFEAASHFAIHVLSAGQRALAERFSLPGRRLRRGSTSSPGFGGAPLLAGCAARFECRHAAGYDGGDHLIVVGEVLRLEQADLPPLLFHRGGYWRPRRRLSLPSAALRGRRAPERRARNPEMAKDKAEEAPPPARGDARRASATISAPRCGRAPAMLARITEVYHAWGFDPLETSAVETVEALGKFLPDVDRPNEGVFAWQDEDEQWLALRYDLTAPLARVYAQHRHEPADAVPALPGRPGLAQREAGAGAVPAVLPVRRGHRRVGVGGGGRRDVRDARRGAGGGGDRARRLRGPGQQPQGAERRDGGRRAPRSRPIRTGERRERRGIVLRAIDKLDRLGESGVRAARLGEVDKIGDDRRAQLRQRPARRVRASCPSSSRLVDDMVGHRASSAARRRHRASTTCANLRELVRRLADRPRRAWRSSRAIAETARGARHREQSIDPSVVRGLGYYTGPVFEAELTFEVVGDDGRPRQFGSVAGGGRYDDLVRRFTGEAVPATGISIGVDRLLAALGEKGRLTAEEPGPVVVTVMDRDRMAGYQAMAAELRARRLRAEVFLGGGNMARQLKYADQRARGGRGDRGRRRAGARRRAAQGPGARRAARGGDRDARGLAGAAGAGRGAARRAGRGGPGDAGARAA